ncbi:MAG: hypothetical protein P8Y66_02565 [Nitrospirota bacterium]|jgi:hypothetical protein
MNTLFDFLTHVKAVEYILAISAIAGFILLWELLKPRPFQGLAQATREDAQYIRSTGYRETMRSVGRMVSAPFIGLLYVTLLPLTFVAAIAIAVVNGLGRLLGAGSSYGWSPVEAYFTGRKKNAREGKGGRES